MKGELALAASETYCNVRGTTGKRSVLDM
jgi:hypothetical protein